MNLKPLQENGLETVCEKGHGKLQVFVQGLFDEHIAFGKVSVENEREVVGVDGHLVSYFVLLVVKEVFK